MPVSCGLFSLYERTKTCLWKMLRFLSFIIQNNLSQGEHRVRNGKNSGEKNEVQFLLNSIVIALLAWLSGWNLTYVLGGHSLILGWDTVGGLVHIFLMQFFLKKAVLFIHLSCFIFIMPNIIYNKCWAHHEKHVSAALCLEIE